MGLSSVFGFTGESKRPWPRVEATTTACWQRWAIRTTSSSSKWLFEAFLHVILFKCFCCWRFWKLRFRVSIWRRDECTANICQQTIRHLGISTFLFFSPSDIASESGSYIYSTSFLLIAEIVHQSMGYLTYIYICSHTNIRISPTNHITF